MTEYETEAEIKKIKLIELIFQLKSLNELNDPEIAHCKADSLLLDYINDKEVSDAFCSIEMWYA